MIVEGTIDYGKVYVYIYIYIIVKNNNESDINLLSVIKIIIIVTLTIHTCKNKMVKKTVSFISSVHRNVFY